MRIFRLTLVSLAVFLSVGANAQSALNETPVQLIPLAAPLDQGLAEFSGMTWCGDQLILIPQYPKRFAKQYTDQRGSYFYAIAKQDIVNYLDGKSTEPLTALTIKVRERSLRARTLVFDGYEGAACEGNQLWLTIESESISKQFRGYLVPATLQQSNGNAVISIHDKRIIRLGSQSKLINKGDEAVTLWGNSVISFHEVNSLAHVKKPMAQVFDVKTRKRSKLDFPDLAYRLTDVTSVDSAGRFWGINYRYGGDDFSKKSDDGLLQKYSEGTSHRDSINVERLLEFQINQTSISLVDRAPLQLLMESPIGRNWEALARLDNRGLLIATDKHPTSLFGFVPLP